MEHTPLETLQESYRQAVDDWLTAIRAEEALTPANPTVAQVDLWEGAHFTEEIARHKAKQAQKDYQAAILSKAIGS